MLQNEYKTLNDAINSVNVLITKAGKEKEKKLAGIKNSLDEIMQKPATVLVCGEFKRGKSTFINALIGRSVCPTDQDICTSVVSIIKYGPKERVTRNYGDFSNIKSEEIKFENLEDYVVGNANDIGNTLFLDIEMPLDELKNGLRIIDTPGVGGLDPRHATLTNYFLPQADVTLFMTEVGEPLTSTELDFYKKVNQYSKHSAVIVNKADTKTSEKVEEIRLDTLSKISEHTQKPAESLDVITASAFDCIKKRDGLGNFEKVRTLIWRKAQEFKAEIFEECRAELSEAISMVLTPIQAQLDQIECPNVDQIANLNEQKNKIERKIVELSDPNSDLRQKIAKKISDAQFQVTKEVNELSTTLMTDKFNALLADPKCQATGCAKWLGEQLNDKIQELSAETTLKLNRVFGDISKIEEFEGKLRYNVADFKDEIAVRNVDPSMPKNRYVSSAMGGWGPAIVSGVVLSAIGITGLWIPALIGIGVAAANCSDNSKTYTTNQLKSEYAPQLQNVIQDLRTYVANRFSDFQRESLRILSSRAKEHKQSIVDAINQIQTLKQQINTAVSRKVVLQNQINLLKKAKDSIDSIEF